jgi:outer membrane protein assembly factor BamA
MLRKLALAVVLASSLAAQSLPLESLVLEGTSMPRDTVLAMAGLRIGGPIDKAAIEAACGKLTDTGLIQSISYRYARGPKRGWVLTLTIEDQKQFTAASIDFPGVDDADLWRWLEAQYPAFDHKVPANDPAQDLIAKALAEHAKAELDGQAVVTRMESDLRTGKSLISFQPANLPRIAAMNFTGQHELSADALTAVLAKLVADDGYTDRHFRQLVEINLRRAYEEHGMYRVKFPKIDAEKAGAGRVTVTTAIEEGAQFKLGEVSFVGDNLPVEAMLKAAKFRKGQVANWTEIQSGIWAAERPVKRTGYFAAASQSERILHDDQSVLDVKISFAMGPLFHAGQLKIIGLTPELEAKARKLWKAQPGDPYDFEYAGEFLREFGQSVSLGQFKKITPSIQRQADNVMDCTLLFESR